MKNIRTKVRCTLAQNGTKHKWVYDQIGISKSHFSHWLNGDRSLKQEYVFRICTLLGLSDELN